MNELIYILEDELPGHYERLNKIENDIKEQGKEKSIAFSQGETFHDNPAGEQVEMEQKMSSRQLSEINNIINTSRKLTFDILKNSPEHIVSIGKVVDLLIGDEEKTIIIGGYHTPIKGRISYEAPLAKAVLGKEDGEEAKLVINGKTQMIEILSVSRIES